MRDTDRVITESFTEDRGTVLMDDAPWSPPRHTPAIDQPAWYGRRAPELTYATPERRALHEHGLCAALVTVTPRNRNR